MTKTIQVRVKPNARVSSLEMDAGGQWVARLSSPPVDGRANAELVKLLARRFSCPRSAITIKSGAGARVKLIRIEGG